jgi:NTE family protein
VVFEGLFSRNRSSDRAVEATTTASEAPHMVPPSIGLALGGGAARGFAHLGVMRRLIEAGIKPDVIVGTSIGAVVGGCYAADRLEPLDKWARGLTLRGLIGNLDISFAGSGLLGGRHLAKHLSEALADARIEKLPIRFAAIATEFPNGHEIWLTQGRLVDALRASYALPGIFPPVRVAGRWLLDGALVNPVPVSAARALGARVVIAVHLNAELPGRGAVISNFGDEGDVAEVAPLNGKRGLRAMFSSESSLRRSFFGDRNSPGIPAVMIEAFNIMQDRITRSRMAGDPPDVLITPRVGPVGWFDFHKAADAIRLGEEAAEKALPAISEAIAALSTPAVSTAAAK